MKGEIITTIQTVQRTVWGVASCAAGLGVFVGLVLPWRYAVALAALAMVWGAWRSDNTGQYRPAASSPPSPPRRNMRVKIPACAYCGTSCGPLANCTGCGAGAQSRV